MAEKPSYKMLEEEIKHTRNSIDKMSCKNSELFYEVEMWRKAYEDLSEKTGQSTLEPYKKAFDSTVEKLRGRLKRKLKKNAGK